MSAAAVLFDMDGLLIDSEPLWTVAEIELAERLGGEFTAELKAAIVGTRLEHAIGIILHWYDAPAGPEDVTAAMDFLLRRMVELYSTELPVLPGVLELLAELRRRTIPVALVSSSYRVLVDAALHQLERLTGVAPLFEVTVAGDELTLGKPDPEPYLRGCVRLGVTPERCVVLEDAPSGVASGEAAGCRVVAVPSVAPIDATPRRPVLASLAGVDVEWLLSLAG